jgi:alanine racemase
MSVFTRISEIRESPAGSCVGYGRSSRIGEDKRVGVLPAGYADGLSRKTSGKGEVVVNDRKARTVGKISANHTVVDLSGIDDASVGDRVELIGKTNPAPVLGEKIGASVLELLAPFGSREVDRVYSEDLTDKKTS